MYQWQKLMAEVATLGDRREDRTGVGTTALFGTTISFDLRDGFPAVTTKELKMGQCWAELAAFLEGAETKEDFNKHGCTIWDGNIDAWDSSGQAGRIYGVQWRRWIDEHNNEIDQLQNFVDGLVQNPTSRRHLVTAWNPGDLDNMCLPPCHYAFQGFVRQGHTLDFLVQMRSVDLFLGLPFDIASYATLQSIIAQQIGMIAGKLTFCLGDTHIYNNHWDAVKTVLDRQPLSRPKLVLDPSATINNFRKEMASLEGYSHCGFVQADLNV